MNILILLSERGSKSRKYQFTELTERKLKVHQESH